VIKKVCEGFKNKEILLDNGKNLKEKEVACALSWCEDAPPNTKLIVKTTTPTPYLEEGEGKWKTHRRKTRASKIPKEENELKLDVGKSWKQNKRMKQLAREVTSGRKPTLDSITKGRKLLFYNGI